MKPVFRALASAVWLVAAPVAAQEASPISRMIADQGLAAAEADLAAVAAPDAGQLFALGGVRFLRGVEVALQTRWRHGAAPMPDYIPILRLELPPNPAPEAVDDAMVTRIFATALTNMESAIEALAAVPDNGDPGLAIDIRDIWFDVNMNATREPFEGLLEVLGAALDTTGAAPFDSTVIRFDAADVAWLQAYAHLIAGVSEIVLAFDTAEVIEKVRTARERANEMQFGPSPYMMFMPDGDRWLDLAAIQILILRQQPDAVRTRKARLHLLQMVAQNRVFWTRLAAETDDEAEWIPADGQTSALGFDLPEGIGAVWLGVLTDAEDMLEGRLLIPHWRFGPGFGINARAYLENPNPLDLVGWIHGMDALDYVERGPVIDGRSWRGFEQLVGRQGLMVALLLN